MKGVVFREFLNLVDTAFSPEITEKIITNSKIPSAGAYTSVGTYDHVELVKLVTELSRETDIPVSELVETFGSFLFERFIVLHENYFSNVTLCFQFLEFVDSYIHVEVKKLYPDAELPSILTEKISDNQLLVIYQSDKAMGDLALGLIKACIKYFNENISISRTDIADSQNGEVHFLLTKT